MPSKDDMIVKRIIKSYLHFKGEATTRMICNHINETNYGLRKTYTPYNLTRFMKLWRHGGKSGSWFNVEFIEKNRETWWRLK